jgi:pyridoxal 5'-phosphate synthase pdxT subunit
VAGDGAPPVGVLALQGDFEAHGRALARAGVTAREVRTAEEILGSSGLVVPGGESTTLWKLMEGTGIAEAIRTLARRGDPLLATCAGAILVSAQIRNPDREGLGLLDATVVRNAYGRQPDSAVVRLDDLDRDVLGGEPMEAVFIRAPRFTRTGPGVEVLARRGEDPVLLRQGNLLAATFHPELSGDDRVQRLFAAALAATRAADVGRGSCPA